MCLLVEKEPIGDVHNNVQSSRRSSHIALSDPSLARFAPLQKMNHLHSRKFAAGEPLKAVESRAAENSRKCANIFLQ